MSERHETHVVEERPTEAAATTEVAATAVALAEATAAAAELHAAEQVRDYAAELDACRTQIANLGGLITQRSDADTERERILAERLTSLESSLAERTATLEELRQHPLLIRPASPQAADRAEGEIAGAGADLTLGPVEGEISSEISSPDRATPSASPEPPRRRRKWI